MSLLIVTAHPDQGAVTHRAAARLRELVGPERVRMAHLAQEGFDPRCTPADLLAHRGLAAPDYAVRAQQRRVDGADHLALVFPVTWWTLPALLKGWIDRVFVAGWAFDREDGRVVPRLGHLTVHLLPVSGASAASFARHGHADAFSAQIERGVVEFCGARHGVTAFLHDGGSGGPAVVSAALEDAAGRIADAVGRAGSPP